MKGKKNTGQMPLNLGSGENKVQKKEAAEPSVTASTVKETAASVHSFAVKKAEKDRTEEGKLYSEIAKLVSRFK